MLTFGWGEILLVLVIIIIFVGPKELPNIIKQLTSFIKSIKKLSQDFKSSLSEIADYEDFKDAKSMLNEVNKIKNILDIEDGINSKIETIKKKGTTVKKEVQDINSIDHK